MKECIWFQTACAGRDMEEHWARGARTIREVHVAQVEVLKTTRY